MPASVKRVQCAKCPWKVSTDPFGIPGYDPELHARLASTIEEPGSLQGLFAGEKRIMACHESAEGGSYYCVGWIANQLGAGNNIPLRLAVSQGKLGIGEFELVGPQHERFEDTMPARWLRARDEDTLPQKG